VKNVELLVKATHKNHFVMIVGGKFMEQCQSNAYEDYEDEDE